MQVSSSFIDMWTGKGLIGDKISLVSVHSDKHAQSEHFSDKLANQILANLRPHTWLHIFTIQWLYVALLDGTNISLAIPHNQH